MSGARLQPTVSQRTEISSRPKTVRWWPIYARQVGSSSDVPIRRHSLTAGSPKILSMDGRSIRGTTMSRLAGQVEVPLYRLRRECVRSLTVRTSPARLGIPHTHAALSVFERPQVVCLLIPPRLGRVFLLRKLCQHKGPSLEPLPRCTIFCVLHQH